MRIHTFSRADLKRRSFANRNEAEANNGQTDMSAANGRKTPRHMGASTAFSAQYHARKLKLAGQGLIASPIPAGAARAGQVLSPEYK